MSAYKIDIEKKVKMEYPEAWELMELMRKEAREQGLVPINFVITTDEMTEDEEVMVYMESRLRCGSSLQEAEREAKEWYEQINKCEKKITYIKQQGFHSC